MIRKSITAFIAAVCLLTFSTAYAGLVINPFMNFTAAPAFNFRATYTDPADLSSRSYLAADVGVDHSTRISFVTSESAGGTGDTAMTICGVGATSAVVSANTGRWSSIWYAATGGLGTSCTITITHGGTPTASTISVYAGYPASSTPVDTATQNTSAASPVASDLAKTNGGFTICSVEHNAVASTISVAQNGAETVTEDADTDAQTFSSGSYSHINTATTTTDDYTATISGSSGRSISCASWGP